MSARPIKDFMNRRQSLQTWMVLFALAGALILGSFLPVVGLGLGAGIFLGTAAILLIEKKLVDDKKKEAAKAETKTTGFGRL